MNIRGLMARVNKIEMHLPRASVHLWCPTEAETRAAVAQKAQELGIPESLVDVHAYKWLDE